MELDTLLAQHLFVPLDYKIPSISFVTLKIKVKVIDHSRIKILMDSIYDLNQMIVDLIFPET